MPTSMMLPSSRVRVGGQNSGCGLNHVMYGGLRTGATARPKTAAAAPVPNGCTKGKQFKCEHCHRLFSTKGNMVRHVQATHAREGVKMFPCETCGKAFKRKEDLIMHTRVHTGERARSLAVLVSWRLEIVYCFRDYRTPVLLYVYFVQQLNPRSERKGCWQRTKNDGIRTPLSRPIVCTPTAVPLYLH